MSDDTQHEPPLEPIDITVRPLADLSGLSVGPPRRLPTPAVLSALENATEGEPSIGRVYLFDMTTAGHEPRLTLGFELQQSLESVALQALVDRLATAVQPLLGADETLDFLPLRNESLRAMVRRAMPPSAP